MSSPLTYSAGEVQWVSTIQPGSFAAPAVVSPGRLSSGVPVFVASNV